MHGSGVVSELAFARAQRNTVLIVDDLFSSRLLLADGTNLTNLFGIGLGTGYKLPSSMGGEPNFDGQANSLWLYHNDIGAIIYRAIHELTRQPAAAVAA